MAYDAAPTIHVPGVLDIITANQNGDNIGVFLGNGDGTFGNAANFATDRGPAGIAVGDVNGDGFADIVTANLASDVGGHHPSANTLTLYLGNGSGGFTASPVSPIAVGSGTGPETVTIADVNGDGFGDIIDGNYYGGSIRVFLSHGDGTFAAQTAIATGAGTGGVASGDFNNDGKLDLAVSNFGDSTVKVLLGDGTGAFAASQTLSTSTGPVQIQLGDLNGDGFTDIVVADYVSGSGGGITTALGNGNGTFQAPVTTTVAGAFGFNVAMGDIDNDGKLDLVVPGTSNSSLRVLRGDGAGGFALAATINTGGTPSFRPQSVSLMDVNRDGNLDIVAAGANNASPQGEVWIALGNGNNTFGAAVLKDTGGLDPNSMMVASLRPVTTAKNTSLVFSSANGNAFSVGDADGASSSETMTLAVKHGTLTLGTTANITGLSGNGTASVTFSGTIAHLNTALNGLVYAPTTGFHGVDSVALTIDDNGVALPATASQAIKVGSGTNTAPVGVTDTGSVAESATLTVNAANGVLHNDTDADSDTLTVTAIKNASNVAGTVGSSLAGTYGHLTIHSDGSYDYVADNTSAINAATTGSHPQDVFTYTLSDGLATATSTLTVSIDRPGIATADAISTTESATVTASTRATGLLGNDTDPDTNNNTGLSVTAVNGSAGHVGSQVTFADSSFITVNADGTYTYDPNHAWDFLPSSTSGAPSTGTETFSYTITGGAIVTDTITVHGQDSNDTLQGSAGADTFNGGIGDDLFLMDDGGTDNVNGGAGNDLFVFGAALTAADVVNGGTNTDAVFISGEYTASHALLLNPTTFTGIEGLALGGGHSYAIFSNDASVAAGQTLVVDALLLGSSDVLSFDGTSEHDGHFAFRVSQNESGTFNGGTQSDSVQIGWDTAGPPSPPDFNGTRPFLDDFADGVLPGVASTFENYSFAQGDFVDLSAVADNNPGFGDPDLTDYARIVASGSDLNFQVDLDGTGGADTWQTVVILGGAAAAQSAIVDIDGTFTTLSSNTAPVITGDGHTVSYTEQAAGTVLEPALVLADDGTNLVSAQASLSGFLTGDELRINGTTSGTIGAIGYNYDSGTGTLTLTGTDTVAHYQAALRLVTFDSTSDNPTASGFTTRDIGWLVNDGTFNSSPGSTTVTITPVDDPGVGHADTFTGIAANAVFTSGASVLDDNGSGADTDVDGPALQVTAVNGDSANVGNQITLASGALLTVNADGTFTYDPNHHFDTLAAPTSGAADVTGSDSFTYQVNGSADTTVTLSIDGVDNASTVYIGSGSADVIHGDPTVGALYQLQQGGEDTVTGSSGNDGFYFGNAFTGGDQVDGGAGTNDQIGLEGDYTGANAVVLDGTAIQGIEVLAMIQGFNYEIATLDNLVAAAQTFTFWSVSMASTNHVHLDGHLESDGAFRFLMGAGADTAIGGAGADLFVGNGGQDTLTGNGGADLFQYLAVSDSTGNANGTAYDIITDFTPGTDKINVGHHVSALDTAITTGTLSSASFDTDLAAAVGAGQLGIGHAVLFTADAGTLSGQHFLVVDANGTAGYQSGADFVIDLDTANLTGFSTASFV